MSAPAAKEQKPQGALVKGYLALYNAASAAGWAYLNARVALHYANPTGISLYEDVGDLLKIVQTAALLEIVHAVTGMVRSDAVTTIIQVFSRLMVLWGIVHISPPSQQHWAFALMTASWALVEVPRYLFYLYKLLAPESMPYWLLWLRYSLFIVLYPSGITGEVLSLFNSLGYVADNRVFSYSLPNKHNIAFNYFIFLCILLSLYAPGSPYMIMHMWNQRSKELKKARDGAAAAPATASEEKAKQS